MVQLVKILSNDPGGKSTTYLGGDGQAYTLKGDLSQRANNPGNISPSGRSARGVYEGQFGAIGYLPSSPGQPAVAVFPTLDAGQQAQQYLWSTPAYQNKTIAQAAQSWASAPYTAQLAAAAGVPSDTKISDLSPDQMGAIFSAQNQAEGSNNLRVVDANGNSISPVAFRGTALDAASALAGAPNNPALAYAPNSPMAGLYGAAPAPLAPPLPSFGGRLSGAAMNGVDKITPPGQHLALPVVGYGGTTPSADATYGLLDPAQNEMNWGDPLSAQMSSMLTPQAATMPPLPIPRPNPPSIAPVPFPGRPPDILPQTSGAPAPTNLVRLPSGKLIAPGTYPSTSNPGSIVTVADDGAGNAVLKTTNPGFMNTAKMGPGTVAGSVVGQKLAEAGGQIKDQAGAAIDNAGASLNNLKDQAGAAASNFASSAGSMLSGLFSPKPPPVPPAPVPSQSSFLPSGNAWTNPLATLKPPTVYPGDISAGGAPVVPPIPKASVPAALPAFMPSGSSWATPFNAVPPAAPAIPVPAAPRIPVLGTPPGTDLALTPNVVPPVPFGNPPWLAPMMPQSSVIIPNIVTQAIGATKPGILDAARFLSGGGNNYTYLAPAANRAGVAPSTLHAALMAQQNRSQGGPAGMPTNFNSSYFESAI